MDKSKQFSINMIANLISFAVSLCISFFLSPYIVATIGVEANGFITLANNFISYIGIVTIALNSMTGRFVTINLYQNKIKEANKIFTSALFANIIIAFGMSIIGTIFVFNLEHIINIPNGIVHDVKLLFLFLLVSCLISIVGSVFGVAAFARNKLYLEYFRTLQGTIARALVIFGGFFLFSPKVWYVGLGGLVSSVIILINDLGFTKKLLPEIRVRKRNFHISRIIMLLKSGVWNTVNKLGQILADGLDLLITNLFIDATAMGVLALAKTVPNLIYSLMGSVVGIFTPDFTILYAQEKYDELVTEVKQSMKVMGFITNIPVIILIVCGIDFFMLWQPTQNARELQILSLITIACLVFSGSVNSIYNIFTVVNKLKLNAIVVLIHGAASALLVFILLRFTNLGIFAIAGVSSCLGIIRVLAFTLPYGAKCLKQKWHVFFLGVFKIVFYTIISSIVCVFVLKHLPNGNWILLCLKGLLTLIISGVIGSCMILNKEERRRMISLVNYIKKKF